MALFGIFSKEKKDSLNKGLEKTKESVLKKISRLLIGHSKIDDDLLDGLEEALITSDVGVGTTLRIIKRLETKVASEKYLNAEELRVMLRNEITALLDERADSKIVGFNDSLPSSPYVILVVGVNGVGKTTTIGKMAYQFKQAGRKVVLGAADTYRAAAIEQLTIWSERAGVDIIKHHSGADPAAVAFDTVNSVVSKGYDVAIIDTAGRLHNKVNLMNELSKIKRVVQKVIPDAPHEVLLVLDGSTGQNAFEQAKQFTVATDVTGLVVTKLDGTAKGGVVLGISDQLQIPVRFIGIGEKMDDLQVFNKYEFVDSLFN